MDGSAYAGERVMALCSAADAGRGARWPGRWRAQALPAAAMANLRGVRDQANDATQTASYGGVWRRGGRVRVRWAEAC